MEVRPVARSDFDGWVRVYFSRYDEVATNPELGVFTRPQQPSLADEATWWQGFQGRIEGGDTVAVVAEESGELVGIAEVTRKGSNVEDRHIGILGIALVPEVRGRGFGSELLGTLLRECRGKFEIIQLGVISVNERARRLYSKYGFKEYGRAPRGFKRGDRYFDEVLMWRAAE